MCGTRLRAPILIIAHFAGFFNASQACDVNNAGHPLAGVELAFGDHTGIRHTMLGRHVNARRTFIPIDGR
jgi:hypothetical protein